LLTSETGELQLRKLNLLEQPSKAQLSLRVEALSAFHRGGWRSWTM
jgi:hypothetical protein